MLNQFRKYNREKQLFHSSQKILVAVSGGVDSMVLLWLLRQSGVACGVAHCNFGLRGEESDRDAEFVQQYALAWGLDYYCERFDTDAYARRNGLSIQMAARTLRYRWFETLRSDKEYQKVAIAHQRDDHVETFFLNLVRGTGVQGLCGINEEQDFYIRPLLFASREQIARFAAEKEIPFREDSSNASDKYSRNDLRHNVLPAFYRTWPSFGEVMVENMERFRDAVLLYQDAVQRYTDSMLTLRDGRVHISLSVLRASPAPATLLFEILRHYGFSRHVPAQILTSWNGLPGKQFLSSTHRLVADRDTLILERKPAPSSRVYYLEEESGSVQQPVEWEMQVFDKPEEYTPSPQRGVVSFDRDRLQFPLLLRRWRQGDYFMPLGLQSMKKLSDFFTDRKLSLPEKESLWILASGDEIVWVVGLRIDHRFRVTDETTRILEIRYNPSQ